MFTSEGIDRRFYELCVMAELKNALPSGDVAVRGSRQFQNFEDYLMPRPEFERKLAQGSLHVAAPTSPAAFMEGRMSLLQQALDQTDALARCGQFRGDRHPLTPGETGSMLTREDEPRGLTGNIIA